MILGAEIGGLLGSAGGHSLGESLGMGDLGSSVLGAIGGAVGGALGTIFPFFKTGGGGIKGARRNAHLVIVHGGEHILPANAHITKEQSQVIRSNKLKKKHGSSVYNR